MKIGLRKWNFFGVKEFFIGYYDCKNEGKNEFPDDKERSCNGFKNKVSPKIDFSADGTHESHPTAWKLKEEGKESNI